MDNLNGKVAIVTGGASGMGREACILFAKEGAKVVCTDINVAGGEEVVKIIKEAGGEAMFLKCDVSKEEDVKNMVETTVATYGSLNYAFNNAGTDGITARDLHDNVVDCSMENYDFTVNLMLRGTFMCMKYEIPEMVKAGGGAVVNNATMSVFTSDGSGPAYIAAKSGICGMTRSAAMAFANKNVRVNAICPGYTWTPQGERWLKEELNYDEAAEAAFMERMIPMARWAKPSEQADAAIALCKLTYVTGVSLRVDGGVVIMQ